MMTLKPYKCDSNRHIYKEKDKYTRRSLIMANLICPCGYVGNPTHVKTCEDYKIEVDRLSNSINSYILDLYNQVCSISACVENIVQKEDTVISPSRIRLLVEKLLEGKDVTTGFTSKMIAARQARTKKTMLEKYGVENYGQLPHGGWGERNKIPYKKLTLSNNYTAYRKKVDYFTRKLHERLLREDNVPTKCFYTGCTFTDAAGEPVNPNDPFKRSVDHRIPVIESFVKGVDPEDVATVENTVYCLRIVNNLKSNTNEDHFVKEILPKFKELLLNES